MDKYILMFSVISLTFEFAACPALFVVWAWVLVGLFYHELLSPGLNLQPNIRADEKKNVCISYLVSSWSKNNKFVKQINNQSLKNIKFLTNYYTRLLHFIEIVSRRRQTLVFHFLFFFFWYDHHSLRWWPPDVQVVRKKWEGREKQGGLPQSSIRLNTHYR